MIFHKIYDVLCNVFQNFNLYLNFIHDEYTLNRMFKKSVASLSTFVHMYESFISDSSVKSR